MLAEKVRFGVRHGPSTPGTPSPSANLPTSRKPPERNRNHLRGQKLRLGGDALSADPTYLLYLPSRSLGGLRRIDFAAWPRAAVSPRQVAPESTRKPLMHTRSISKARSVGLEVTL